MLLAKHAGATADWMDAVAAECFGDSLEAPGELLLLGWAGAERDDQLVKPSYGGFRLPVYQPRSVARGMPVRASTLRSESARCAG